MVIAPDRGAEGGDTVVNKKDDWHRERRVGEAVKAGIKCFCGSEAYRDILEVTMNCETFPRVHRIFCPNCGLQMRNPAGNDDEFIVRQWRDISDLHQHRKEEQDRADRAVGMTDIEKVIEGLKELREYADSEIHQIVSPDNWSVYSRLRDLIDETENNALTLLKTQECCSDVVSREEVLKEQYEVHTPEYGIVNAVPVEYIKSLKPIAPQTPEPRLLELDEIKMLGLMWLESRNGFVQPVICQNYEFGVDKSVGFIMVHGTICNSINTFGKLWRVWTSEPSKEQREAMRWWNE